MHSTTEKRYYTIGDLIAYAHGRSQGYPAWTTEHLTYRRAITMLQCLAETMEAERLADEQAYAEEAGYEVMMRPCIHCHTPLADTFPYALCTPCQETGSCVHGNRYKDGCSACDADSDFLYDARRENR